MIMCDRRHPPLNLVIDGPLIAKQCDGTVLVVGKRKDRQGTG